MKTRLEPQFTCSVDRIAMLRLVPKGLTCVELGVDRGRYSRAIWTKTRPSILHLVDLWRHPDKHVQRYTGIEHDIAELGVKAHFKHEVAAGTVVIHKGRTVDVMATMEPRSIDWLYVDADHTHEGAYNDLVGAKRVMKDDGFIAGHDYIKIAHYGVIEAVEQFLQENEDMMFLCKTPEKWASYVLVPVAHEETYTELFSGRGGRHA